MTPSNNMAKLLRPMVLLLLLLMGMFMLCPNPGLCDVVDSLDSNADEDESLIVAVPVTNATKCFLGNQTWKISHKNFENVMYDLVMW
mgnify:CR=1 FL=1